MSNGEATFKVITNDDIFAEVRSLHVKFDTLARKVSVNRWIGTTALSISLLLVGFMLKGAL